MSTWADGPTAGTRRSPTVHRKRGRLLGSWHYGSSSRAGNSRTGPSSATPIIADLRGRVRIEYSTYDELKDKLYERYFPSLELFRRWRRFRRKRTLVPVALKVFQELREHERLKKAEMTQLLATEGLKQAHLVPYLKEAKLILERKVRNGGFYFPSR